MRTRIIADEVLYPSGDGQPMAETGIHVQAIILLHQALQDFFKNRPDVFIASDMFWYYEEGNRKARIAPDVMAVPGVGNQQRRSFFSWKEPEIPAVVFEMASKKTWRADLNEKYKRYQSLGVKEYFIFDPEDLYLDRPLLGFRLIRSLYRPIKRTGDETVSDLGFWLRPEGRMLRLTNGRTQQPILTRSEAVDKAEAKAYRAAEAVAAAKAELRAEKVRADALAAELAKLKKQSDGGES